MSVLTPDEGLGVLACVHEHVHVPALVFSRFLPPTRNMHIRLMGTVNSVCVCVYV